MMFPPKQPILYQYYFIMYDFKMQLQK